MNQELLNDIVQWDVKNWSKLIKFWSPIIKEKSGNKALALGEREGGLTLWLALNGKEVTCTDYIQFDQTPLPLHVKYNVEDKINYKQEDATKLSFKDNYFDIIIFKSMLGALESNSNQQKALDEVFRVLKPNGVLLFAENLKASKLHQFARKKFTAWGEKWYYPSIKELETNCNKFNSFKYETNGFLSPFGRTEKQREKLSFLDKKFKFITPKNWTYILFGIAIK